jgi:hypothetical protein
MRVLPYAAILSLVLPAVGDPSYAQWTGGVDIPSGEFTGDYAVLAGIVLTSGYKQRLCVPVSTVRDAGQRIVSSQYKCATHIDAGDPIYQKDVVVLWEPETYEVGPDGVAKLDEIGKANGELIRLSKLYVDALGKDASLATRIRNDIKVQLGQRQILDQQLPLMSRPVAGQSPQPPEPAQPPEQGPGVLGVVPGTDD